jgi:hypothetical protein
LRQSKTPATWTNANAKAQNIPGYYEVTKLPIALDTIEVKSIPTIKLVSSTKALQAKLLNGEYWSLSGVESDLKRLVANAKSFNEKGSDLYEDAERVRKTASNWMTRHNPAYRDKNYVAVATPIPEDGMGHMPITPYPVRGGAERPSRAGRKSTSAAPPPPESNPVVEEEPDQYPDSRFKGLTFQQTQDLIVQEFLEYIEYVDRHERWKI